MSTKLFLDDERKLPPSFNTHVYTAPNAIIMLKRGNIEAVSLDHDLGLEEAGTGYDVAKFIEEAAFHKALEPFDCYIHTANPVARVRMLQALLNAQRFWKQHFNKEVIVRVVEYDT